MILKFNSETATSKLQGVAMTSMRMADLRWIGHFRNRLLKCCGQN